MTDKVVISSGGYLRIRKDSGEMDYVPFPVCLAIRHSDGIFTECPDFILSLGKSWVFIRTENPVLEGTSILLHFYIPPEDKLLAEVYGTVVPLEDGQLLFGEGMLVRFAPLSHGQVQELMMYLEGRKHLVDYEA